MSDRSLSARGKWPAYRIFPEPAPRGILYPSIAAGDSVILFDMRKDPSQSKRDEYLRHHRYSIFSNAVKHIRLVCKDFPWQIEIHDEWITCGTIWKRLYGELQEYITEAEWTMMNESRQEVVKKAMKLREAETGIMEMRPKRIDWLDKPMFGGLEKDESFVQRVTWSGKEAVETWQFVVKI